MRYLRATMVPIDESCLIEAASEQLVHEAYARAGIPSSGSRPSFQTESPETRPGR